MFFNNQSIRSTARTIATGTVFTMASTGVSCVMAVAIEGAANKAMYRFFPHWYKDVKYATGLPHLQYEPNEAMMASEVLGSIPEDPHVQFQPVQTCTNQLSEQIWKDDSHEDIKAKASKDVFTEYENNEPTKNTYNVTMSIIDSFEVTPDRTSNMVCSTALTC